MESPEDERLRLEAENDSLRAEIKKLKEMVRDVDNNFVELGAIHEAMVDAINGREPSDFMLSFPEVRTALDLKVFFDAFMEEQARLVAVRNLLAEMRRDFESRTKGGQQVQPRWLVSPSMLRELERVAGIR